MPANSTHPDYDANATAWLRARDVLAGEDAVKAAGERYLPRLDSQDTKEYEAYRARASFFNASARTADGFLGLIFRRDPTVKCGAPTPSTSQGAAPATPMRLNAQQQAMAAFAGDADLLGTSLIDYAKNVVLEVIGVGRAGTLVDWEEKGERRAYAALYPAEHILNWRTERIQGRTLLTLLVLREEVAVAGAASAGAAPGEDEFATETVAQIRVLRLVPSTAEKPDTATGWRYEVELWQERRERAGRRRRANWVKVETRVPLRLGRPLPQIPFVFHGPRHALPHVDKLPLADIIAVNLDHYRLNADYKHGLHFTALPTAWVSGFDKGAELRIGASTAWVTETVGAAAGYLEFTGQGLTTFERAMDRDERLMAILGSRMLEGQKRVGETADAIELRQSGESSVLTTLALSVSGSLTQVLRWVFWWHSTEAQPEDVGPDQVLVQLNTDFSIKGMASDELTAVVAAWQAGAISRETMFDLFRQGEVLPAGRSNEEEKRLVARSAAGEVRPGGGNLQQPTTNRERGGNGNGQPTPDPSKEGN